MRTRRGSVTSSSHSSRSSERVLCWARGWFDMMATSQGQHMPSGPRQRWTTGGVVARLRGEGGAAVPSVVHATVTLDGLLHRPGELVYPGRGDRIVAQRREHELAFIVALDDGVEAVRAKVVGGARGRGPAGEVRDVRDLAGRCE